MSADAENDTPHPHHDDPMLTLMIRVVESMARQDVTVSIGLTLFVGGVVVTGNLISTRAYMQRMATTFEERRDGGIGDALLEPLSKGFKEIADTLYRDDPDDEEGPRRPRFVNLDEAQVISASGAIPTSGGMLVRFRLSEVGGFVMGKYVLNVG